MNIAYVVSRYPAVSHTFIAREVAALRESGYDVTTVTIRRAGSSELLTENDRKEYRRTFAILPTTLLRTFRAHTGMFLASPGAYLATMWSALAVRPPGLRAVLWHLFYSAEATLLAYELRRRRITHIHAHFANVASQVAMLAARMLEHDSSWPFRFRKPGGLAPGRQDWQRGDGDLRVRLWAGSGDAQ